MTKYNTTNKKNEANKTLPYLRRHDAFTTMKYKCHYNDNIFVSGFRQWLHRMLTLSYNDNAMVVFKMKTRGAVSEKNFKWCFRICELMFQMQVHKRPGVLRPGPKLGVPGRRPLPQLLPGSAGGAARGCHWSHSTAEVSRGSELSKYCEISQDLVGHFD